jgi:hypothetical protein
LKNWVVYKNLAQFFIEINIINIIKIQYLIKNNEEF